MPSHEFKATSPVWLYKHKQEGGLAILVLLLGAFIILIYLHSIIQTPAPALEFGIPKLPLTNTTRTATYLE
jgi:hypothetical protein